MCPDKSKAQEQFGKAAACFKRCQQRDPSNEMYRKAIEMCDKAPDYYDEIQSQLAASGMRPGRESGGREEAGGGSDFWWDLAGWALLGTAIVGAMVLTRTAAKPA